MLANAELLEREREIGALSAVIAAAAGGSGCVAVVEGPAGVGKSRLLVAGRAEAEVVGMRVLAARGSALEHEFAFGVVRQLFEPLLASAGEAGRAELLAGAAGQAAPLFDHSRPTAAAPANGDATFAMLHGLFWLVANLSAQGPVMLCVDDLHWCDALRCASSPTSSHASTGCRSCSWPRRDRRSLAPSSTFWLRSSSTRWPRWCSRRR